MSAMEKADVQIASLKGGNVPTRDVRLIKQILLFTGLKWKKSEYVGGNN